MTKSVVLRGFILAIALCWLEADAAARTFTLNIGGKAVTCQSSGQVTECDVNGTTVVFDSGDKPAAAEKPAAANRPGDDSDTSKRRGANREVKTVTRMPKAQPAEQPSAPAKTERPAETPPSKKAERPADQPSFAKRADKAAIVAENERRFRDLAINKDRIADLDAMIERILRDKPRYVVISALTGVPWQVIGIIHTMESNGDFNTHLHNGDPLTDRTTSVPRGRPADGEPPFTWFVSALDAITFEGLDSDPTAYAAVGGTLYWLEAFNGFGYRDLGVSSAYVWACTNQYDSGLYVRDGVFDADKRPDGCGAGAILSRMMERGEFGYETSEVKKDDKTQAKETSGGASSE